MKNQRNQNSNVESLKLTVQNFKRKIKKESYLKKINPTCCMYMIIIRTHINYILISLKKKMEGILRNKK